MKKIITLVLLITALKAHSQCPEWFTTMANPTIIVTRAEQYLGCALLKEPSQPGKNDVYADKQRKNSIYVVANGDGSVRNVQVTGNKDSLMNMLNGYFAQLPADCVIKKGKRFVFTKAFDIVLNFNNVIWITKHDKAND